MKLESINKLKETVISTYKKFGDNTACLVRGSRSYTGHEIAKEIEDETDFGLSFLENLLKLTTELVKRDKINVNISSPKEKRYDEYVDRCLTLDEYIAECYGGLPSESMLTESWMKLPQSKDYKIVFQTFNEKNGHLIILSKEKPSNGEWGFDYRPDEFGKLHPVCYIKQSELTMFDNATERKIIASTSLHTDRSVYKIKQEQYDLIKKMFEEKKSFDLYIQTELYAVGSFGLSDGEPDIDERVKDDNGYCNLLII